jgi:peroxiredoxin
LVRVVARARSLVLGAAVRWAATADRTLSPAATLDGDDCQHADQDVVSVELVDWTSSVISKRLSAGAIIPRRQLETITGQSVSIPAAAGTTHLQFRRFAGCPICSLHLRGFADRHQELAHAGITEVAFFHSSAEALRGYQALLPFAVVADPDKVAYREFGVETSVRAVADPRSWSSAFRGYRAKLGHRNDPDYAGVGSNDGTTHMGLPADFLVGADGTVVALHYGRHADDQWSVDELLDIQRSFGTSGAS